MTAQSRRRLFAISILMLTAVVILTTSGCAADYTWRRVGIPSDSYKWIVVPPSAMYAICATTPHQSPHLAGCAFYAPTGVCTIYSDRTEELANRTLSGDGISVAEHELMHCDGWSHQQFVDRMP